jgi:hypothetical protein
VAIPVYHNVIWLQVSEDDVSLVEVLDGQQDLCDIDPSTFFLEASFLLQDSG